MADVQLPQYPLPNPGLPLGQQAVSPVAQVNPLQMAAQGVSAGGSLGLQVAQIQSLQRERAIQLMQAQAQQKIAQATILKEALGSAHEDFDTLSKINPDVAMDYYHNKIAPLQDEFWSQYGIKMDSSQIPPSHANADVMSQINQATDLALNDPSKIPQAQLVLNHLNNQMNIGEFAKSKIESAQKTVGNFQENQKNQEKLAGEWVQGAESLRGDTVFKGLETQRNSAGQGYSTLKSYQKPDGSFDLSNTQVIDLYGQLWKAQTGGVLSPQELNEMNQNSLQKNYAKTAGLIGLSKNALPTEFGNRLLTMFDQLGNFTDQQHSTMESVKNAKPGGLVDPQLIADTQKRIGRGMTFQEMKSKADADYQGRTTRVTFTDSQGVTHSIPKENLPAAQKRDPGLKVIQ